MPLPTSPNTVYVAGVSMVEAFDLNDIQDCIVDLDAGKHDTERSVIIPANKGAPLVSTGTEWIAGAQGATDADSNAHTFYIPIELPIGTRMKSIDVYVNGDATKTISSRPEYTDVTSGGVTSLGSAATSATTNTNQTLSHASLNETIAAGRAYHMKISSSAAAGNVHCYAVRVNYDWP